MNVKTTETHFPKTFSSPKNNFSKTTEIKFTFGKFYVRSDIALSPRDASEGGDGECLL